MTSQRQNTDTTDVGGGVGVVPSAGQAVLTEAARHVDIIVTSLMGMALIVLILLVAVALPVFGMPPVRELLPFLIMVATAFSGVGYLGYVNKRVHEHLGTQARLTEVLMNSLGQGFLTFDATGVCGRVYSQACLDLLEAVPSGRHLFDILKIEEQDRSSLKEWLEVLFLQGHAVGFDDIVGFFPSYYPHSQGRRVALSYRPIRNKDGAMTGVIVMATDETEEYAAQLRAESQQSYADMICRIFKERNQFRVTVAHARKFIEEGRGYTGGDTEGLMRSLHTLKAAVKYFHFDEMGEVIHQLETDLRAVSDEGAFIDKLRSGCALVEGYLEKALETVHDLVGKNFDGEGNLIEVDEQVIYDFAQEMKARGVEAGLISHFLRSVAAKPASECFRQFERELHDLAEVSGKQVKPVRYTGTNPRILTKPLGEFFFSLTHIGRNIIDHGIEPAVTRMARGKDPAGQISIHVDTFISPEDQREWIHIVISDDGNGIDASKIRERLASRDPQGAWRTESDHAVIQHIFDWGFSTRDNVTDMSGRGVGMEVVLREVQALGGSITVASEQFRGVRFEIKFPHHIGIS